MQVSPPLCIRALILDRQHRCLLVEEQRPSGAVLRVPSVEIPVDAPIPERPLRWLEQGLLTQHGLRLPSPSGSHVPADGASPRDFAFLIEEPTTPPGMRWLPLPQALAGLAGSDADHLFRLYVETLLGGYEPPTREFDVFYFGNEPVQAAKLAHLVIKGKKRTTSGHIAVAEKQGSTIPWPGLISVVTDYYGYPLCVIETLEVRRVPFRDVAPDIAAGEGEGDLSYDDWREGHIAYFTREAAEYGLVFTDDSIVSNEIFRVIKILGQTDSKTDSCS